MEDVKKRMNGQHHTAVESVITKLHAHDINADIPSIIDTLWNKHKDFINKTGAFSNTNRWNVPDIMRCKSHL